MSSINKKGLSEVVATVIFILLSIAAVSLLIPAILSFTQSAETQLSPVVSCLEMQQLSPPKIDSALYNAESGELEVTVSRSQIDDYSLMMGFVLQSDSSSERFECGEQCNGACTLPLSGKSKTFFFSVAEEQVPDEIILYVNDPSCVTDTQTVI